MDSLDNVATRQIRVRLLRKDELLKEEIHTQNLEDDNKDELVLMLEHAGFSDIQSLEISVTNQPRAARAAGRAEAANPLPLFIPCHRVIGSDNKLHGYGMAEGLKTKAWLLTLEGAMIV